MKNIELYYAVCQYVPDEIRAETINIGIVIHCPNKGHEYSRFVQINNRKRLYTFDDDYDSEYIDLMFEHMKYQFNFSDLSKADIYGESGVDEFELINSKVYLEGKIKFYVNEFRFLPIQKIEIKSTEIEVKINDLIRTYLYYDIPKDQRITRSEVQKLLNKEISNLKLKKILKSDEMIVDFDNKPIFDYQYNDTYVRTFSFDYANPNTLTKEVKLFLFDLSENKHSLENKNVVLVLNHNFNDQDSEFKRYSKMFKNVKGVNIILMALPQYAAFLLQNGSKNIKQKKL